MNCARWEPQLSAYIDGALGASDRAAVDAHIGACPACRMLIADIAAVHLAASTLEPLVPPARVWHRLSERARPEQAERVEGATVRPRSFWAWAWVAWRPLGAVAMAALIAITLGRIAALLEPVGSVSRGESPSSALAGDGLPHPEADYTLAIARLEAVTTPERNALDPDTAGAIHAGMTVIDRAIDESRAALQSDPESAPAQQSLVEALRRKVTLLQETLALINDTRTVNEEGTARFVSEINR